ncbi:MAG: ABC transporter permease [Anaerolineae bacterium]|nr:ABC transporter permease [Anaerolineae bacterium]
MIAQYILKSFGRHKARTAIMVMAVLVVTAMLVTLNNGVDSLQQQVVQIVEQFAGEHDIAIVRAETSPDQYVSIERISAILRAADPAVAAIYPRFHTTAELRTGDRTSNVSLVARVPEDDLGQITVLEGEYDLQGDHIVVLKVTADTFGLHVGDQVDVNYYLPISRMTGQDLPQNVSLSHITRRFTISGIALSTGLGAGGQNGVIVGVETVQDWLDVPGRAERLVVVLDEAVYGSLNTQASVFRVRRIAERMTGALGEEGETYVFRLDKAQALDQSDTAFAILRSISAVYGFLVMGVVGLLVYSIINTNVEERQRDLAFLRVLGAKRRHLFQLVIIEVAFIGLIGVGLGILVGQAFSVWVVSPVANHLINSMGSEGTELGLHFQLTITVGAMLRAALIATVVLGLSGIAPARKAARTKMRHAINPGSADSIQIEDLARLRSRKFDMRIVIAGVVLTLMWLIVFIGTEFLFRQGNESVIGAFMFSGLALLVIGVSLLFYALTLPFERLMILLGGLVLPKLSFFAGPNLLRAKQRNTIISLMIVFSATLPTFLGTMTVLEQTNYDTTARFQNGAPVVAQVAFWGRSFSEQEAPSPDFLDEFRTVPGIDRAVGLTTAYRAGATNRVELRNTPLMVQGLTESLHGVVYGDLTTYATGCPEAFETLFAEPDTIIVSQGYAEFMDLDVGDVIRVEGAGKDHIVTMRVVGLIERIAGFESFSRNENYVRWGESVAFVSLDTYIRLTTDPLQEAVCASGVCSPVERDRPIIAEILATTSAGADEGEVVSRLRERFADQAPIWIIATMEEIRSTEQAMRTIRVLMLIMTVLSFVTSIFGVFAVVYVAVYVRRLEIGMLKAIGMQRRSLIGAFALESVMMTVSASLAGVTAGTVLGYVFYISNMTMQDIPTRLTFDWLTALAILVMVILASVFSASMAARGIVRSKVTRILREAL